MNELALNGHDIHLYTSDFKKDKDFLASLNNINIKLFHCWSSFLGFYLMPGLIQEARLNLMQYDIIHLHCFRSFQNIIIIHYAKKYKIPCILDAHGSAKRNAYGNRFDIKSVLKTLFDIAFGNSIINDSCIFIAESKFGINEYTALGIDVERIRLIRSMFDLEEFSKLPKKDTFKNKYMIKQKNIICFLGRLHWIKGIDFIIESFYELAKERDDVILIIVGPDDGYRATLKKLVLKLGLDKKTIFTGLLTGDDKLSALVDSTMLVQTSRSEQGARVPFEAVICNTPIIVSKNNGAGEDVMELDAGYLIDWGDKISLKNTMEYIIDNPDEAKEKTERAKEYIEKNLSIKANIKLYESIYEKYSKSSARNKR
jgi:glycosyltransferase involved in cell wall biosynthesis